jgi:propane monooxygenase reductase subunit
VGAGEPSDGTERPRLEHRPTVLNRTCPHELERSLPSFRYVPALSEPDAADWDGETGLITDVLKRREESLTGAHAYVCGPPPMVEAAMPVLGGLGVEENRIYYDKFTTTGNAEK